MKKMAGWGPLIGSAAPLKFGCFSGGGGHLLYRFAPIIRPSPPTCRRSLGPKLTHQNSLSQTFTIQKLFVGQFLKKVPQLGRISDKGFTIEKKILCAGEKNEIFGTRPTHHKSKILDNLGINFSYLPFGSAILLNYISVI